MTHPIISAKKLPAPRLELRWTEDTTPDGFGEKARLCHYNLVLPLDKHDIRRESENAMGGELRIEISVTKVTSYGQEQDHGAELPTPFRDSAHAAWDSKALGGLSVYVVYGDKAQLYKRDA